MENTYLREFEKEAADNLRKLDASEVAPYFARLEARLNDFSGVLKQTSQPGFDHSFILTNLAMLQQTLECLKFKHSMEGDDKVDFSPSVLAYESGFPSFKEFSLLEGDEKQAPTVIAGLPDVRALLETVKWKVLAGEPIEHEQILLKRHRYFSRLLETNLFPGLSMAVDKPEFKSRENGKRFYVIDWCGLQASPSLPVFYRMWFTQDARYPQLHDDERGEGQPHQMLEEFIQASRMGLDNLRNFATKLNQQIEELHPKEIRKYTVGPFYDELTKNHLEMQTAFDGFENPSALKYQMEMAVSVDITQKIFRNGWEQLKAVVMGRPMEKEVYSETQLMSRGIIVPLRVKQNLKPDCDEFGIPCSVHGITNGGEIV